MTDCTSELAREAGAHVAAARDASLRARATHARAELMRHMMMTTAKSMGEARERSVRLVTDEWLDAWGRTHGNYPFVAQMEALSGACYDWLHAKDAAADAAVRRAFAALDAACVSHGTTIADEMAWRSGCSHLWWGDVRPAPDAPEFRDRARRPAALWERGCPPECLG